MRFPGFTDEWKKTTLGEITTNFNLRNKEQIDYPMFSVTNNRGFIPQSEQFEDREMKGEDIKAYKVIHHNDFAYNPARINVGSIAKYNGFEPCMISSLYVCFKANNEVDEDWLMHLLRTSKVQYYYQLNGEGGVRVYLFYPNFARIRTSIPSIEEQKKIAKILSIIDERIATQNKIIEDLKKLKSAIIDKVFCLPSVKQPNKRLDGFNGDWEIVKLSEICERMTERNSNLKCNLVLTIAAQYGLVSQLDFFNKSVASENLSSYFVLKKGDFAYNKSYSGEYIWGAIKKLDYYEEGVLSPLYICFRPNKNMINPDFLAFYFESKKWHRGISEIAGEGARNHGLLNISVIDFFNTIHRIPSLTEQIRITTVLQTYQNKINNEERLLLQYQTQRKFLLSTMFI